VLFRSELGRLTVKASTKDAYFLRPPHWAPRSEVHAFVDGRHVPVHWLRDHVRFDDSPGDELTVAYPLLSFTHRAQGLWPQTRPDLSMRFDWLGNMVTGCDPAPEKTPLFVGKPRRLAPAPTL
jgi:hypothetical protein